MNSSDSPLSRCWRIDVEFGMGQRSVDVLSLAVVHRKLREGLDWHLFDPGALVELAALAVIGGQRSKCVTGYRSGW